MKSTHNMLMMMMIIIICMYSDHLNSSLKIFFYNIIIHAHSNYNFYIHQCRGDKASYVKKKREKYNDGLPNKRDSAYATCVYIS